ncbi:MAG: hypothetical protein QMC77_04600 [Methanocellales archaeon]|nr:hypothetical protein [Methanocellales archaeon]
MIVVGTIGLIMVIGMVLTALAPIMPHLQASDMTPELILAQTMPMMGMIALAFLVFVILAGLIGAFFGAGAIGMAKKAMESGRATLSDMMEHGKRSFISIFFADIIVGLMLLAGMVFLVPSLLSISDISAIPKLLIGALMFMLYAIILSIIFAVVRYAIVVDGIGAIKGVKRGARFFLDHKLDVFLVWLIIVAISAGLSMISMIMEYVPYVGTVWPVVNFAVSIVVIAPLSIIWWTGLYMSRAEKATIALSR